MKCFVKGIPYASAACICLYGLGSQALAAPYQINTATGLFTPSFRGAANSTWFGWGPGTFDASVDNELVDSPPQTLNGIDPPTGINLIQNNTTDILSGSNNIYNIYFGTGPIPVIDLTLTVPTSGTVGAGFTTIIVQGRTIFGGYPTDVPEAFTFGGPATPTYVQGTNANAVGQFWVKYEVPGNAALYDLEIDSNAHSASIAELVVDTYWSQAGYAGDLATVPEPVTSTVMAFGLIPLMRQYRKRHR